MLSKLDNLKQKVQNKSSEGDTVTSLYYLIKELKCLSDIVGREFEVIYERVIWYKPWTWNKIKKIIQKPIAVSTLSVLFNELEKDVKRQEREMNKSKVKGRR